MTLTKDDLRAIRGVVKEELEPFNKKFDKLFNFLDKKYLEVKKDVRVIQNHLHLPVSDF